MEPAHDPDPDPDESELTMRNVLRYSTILIGTYLLVAYATGSGRVISESTRGAANVIKAFQGRS